MRSWLRRGPGTGRLASGAQVGPLHGIPIGVKDIYYTAGIPTTACSRVYADFVPEYDAVAGSSMLKGAGAIMLGKTVTTEFACMDPSPDRQSLERCPYSRRVQQRVGGGGGRQDVPRGHGFADGRFGAASGLLQWRSGVQAQLREGQQTRRHPGKLVPGYHGMDDPDRWKTPLYCCR